MQLHRSYRDKVVGGVCSGIAETLGIEPLYIRLLFLFLLIYAGTALWVYLIMWLIVPVIDTGINADSKKFYRSRRDSMLGGVCGGLAAAYNTDATVLRLIVAGLALVGGFSIVPYLVLWLITPVEPF